MFVIVPTSNFSCKILFYMIGYTYNDSLSVWERYFIILSIGN